MTVDVVLIRQLRHVLGTECGSRSDVMDPSRVCKDPGCRAVDGSLVGLLRHLDVVRWILSRSVRTPGCCAVDP
jgi:hypothetical protein